MLPEERNATAKTESLIIHPGSRALFSHWEAARAERQCPARADLSLTALSRQLPNIAIIAQVDGAWRFRMAGTEVCALLRANVTGKDAMTGFERFERDVVARIFDIAVNQLQPGLIRLRLVPSVGAALGAELLVLPVRDEASGKVQLFSGLFGFPGEAASTASPLLRLELMSARMIWTEHGAPDPELSFLPRKGPHLRVIQGGVEG